VGDFVAAPPRLGDRFDVDLHCDTIIGKVDFHRAVGYLAAGPTRAALAELAAAT
jgi:hypothetical protein